MKYQTSDFDLEFASSECKWGALHVPGLPLLSLPDGRLDLAILAFFGYSAAKGRVAIRSLSPEAYTLRQWLVFLFNKGHSLFDGSDQLMIEFRDGLGWPNKEGNELDKRTAAASIDKRKVISTKLNTIFMFYRDLPAAYPFMSGGQLTPTFVGENKSNKKYPITYKLAWNHKSKFHTQKWFYSLRVKTTPKAPRAATIKEAERLYSFLRGHAFRIQKKHRVAIAPEKDMVIADRNWLMARTMAGGGLRCEEVSELTVFQLAAALFDAGITETTMDLDAIAEDVAAKKRIIARVLSLQDGREYTFLSVRVSGKGSKTRYVPFQIQTICDLLEVGVWHCRHRQISAWKRLEHSFSPPPELFLSFQTKSALSAGSIGDIVAAGFRACGIARSAHKLRGLFATVTAAALWKEYFAQNQYRFDQALINKALSDLATAMGHASVDTTVKFYIDKELHSHLTKIGTKSAKLFRKLWIILVMERRELSDLRTDILLNFADRISRSEDNSIFTLATSAMLEDSRFDTHKQASQVKPKLAYDAS
jgi:hypothetical protein